MNEKINLITTYAELYGASREPSLVRVPELAVFAVDGSGDPRDEAAFQARAELLYTASYALKMRHKKERGVDWKVMPMEGDWWTEDMAAWSMEERDDWLWRLMIVQPDFVTEAEAALAIEETARKRADNPALASLRFERRPAHEAAHILHLGPYSTEPPTIQRLHAYIREQGLKLSGVHRELYLGDPRRTAPERLKTIIRQPIARN